MVYGYFRKYGLYNDIGIRRYDYKSINLCFSYFSTSLQDEYFIEYNDQVQISDNGTIAAPKTCVFGTTDNDHRLIFGSKWIDSDSKNNTFLPAIIQWKIRIISAGDGGSIRIGIISKSNKSLKNVHIQSINESNVDPDLFAFYISSNPEEGNIATMDHRIS